MGSGYWPDYTPGTKYGPCLEDCRHTDCITYRDSDKANPPCKLCGVKLQAGDRYYFEGEGGEIAHALCVEKEVKTNG